MTTRWAPLAITAALVAAVGVAPEAAAVAPPRVDASALPSPAPPAPPGPTEQVGACETAPGTSRGGRAQIDRTTLAALWNLSRGAGQTVAVIDTGVARHRLLPRLTPGGDYVATGDGTQDCDGHGTMVAGIIAASPTDHFAGIAPDAGILAIRQSSVEFRRTDGDGTGVGDVRTLAQAVRMAADAGATVINVSTVACTPASEPLDDRALGAALAYAVDVKNVVVVVAAGNTGAECGPQNPVRGGAPDWDDVAVVASPSWYDEYVLTVGSVDGAGRPSAFTLGGPWVDVAAPGEDVLSLDPAGDGVRDDGPVSGTSYAAPVVAAVAALIRARSPELTARQVMRRIEEAAVRPTAGWDPLVGHGVVDVMAALSDGGAVPTPASPRTADRRPGPASAGRDGRAVAFWGAAACIAVGGALTALTGLARNPLRRRRRESVADGAGTRDAEFGSTR
ncbi:type VII secretion-associated serine protease mycosin [Mycolicibacterium sediminis]|uniref:Membrane-anchored mycosin n=1 Tax=Mycolicibacterium sediminis TaxID=1286180 RepID=A0A7I7QPR7_9MYCO|nr:type VII secretion-associated serine protease mycosin [Mycolicibacterium sediminis]BBY28359.1 membrane-anchored mycosin [Mycolicibacterium sediminis]